MYMFGISFYINSDTKKSDVNIFNCVLKQSNAAESTSDASELQKRYLACALRSRNKKQLAIFF